MFSSFRTILKSFPVINVVRNYGVDKAIPDLVAGISMGLTLIPQSLAYAALAGLSPQYGLYSSLLGGVVYLIFGTVPELNIAPTALISLLTYTYTHNASFPNTQAACLLCFFAGIVELLCGVLQLGFLVDFVSAPVVAAFSSAGAITIASSQVKNLLGLKFTAETFVSVWYNVFTHFSEIILYDALLGLSCIVVLLILRKLRDYGTPPFVEKFGELKSEPSNPNRLKKFVWFLSISRNAVMVISSTGLAAALEYHDIKVFSLTSSVQTGLPNVSLPKFSTVSNNGTDMSFVEMVQEIGTGIFVVPFIAILANIAIAKAFANGRVIDASQEMVAVGMCNIAGSMVGSYPVNASFCRAAISNASGVKTPAAGLCTTLMAVLALTFLTPYFTFIPKPTLSAVVICAVLSMIEIELTQVIWKTNKMDFAPFTITLVSCLFIGIELGILIGVAVDVMLLLYYNARPKVLIEKTTSENAVNYIKVTPLATTLFPSAEYIREKIIQQCSVESESAYKFVVLDCYRMRKIDFTAAKCLAALISDLEKMKKIVIFYRPRESVQKVIKNVCKEDTSFLNTEGDLFQSLKGRYYHKLLDYAVKKLTQVNFVHSLFSHGFDFDQLPDKQDHQTSNNSIPMSTLCNGREKENTESIPAPTSNTQL